MKVVLTILGYAVFISGCAALGIGVIVTMFKLVMQEIKYKVETGDESAE